MTEPEGQATRESTDTKTLNGGRRIDVAVGLAVAAASLVTAIHRVPRPGVTCTADYSLSLRPWIVLAGFIVAGLIIAVGTHAHRSRG